MKKIINLLLAIPMNLQMFAEAGTAVNATGSMVNAYTGATTPYDGNGFSGELKTFYDTELLENARAEMFYAQFCLRTLVQKCSTHSSQSTRHCLPTMA